MTPTIEQRPPGDLRQEDRQHRDESVHIQILRQTAIELQDAVILHVNTQDISQHGFNAASNVLLTPGRLLDVLVELRDGSQAYSLTAEVRWCEPRSEGGFAAGFIVLDAKGTDYHSWQGRFPTA